MTPKGTIFPRQARNKRQKINSAVIKAAINHEACPVRISESVSDKEVSS